MRRVRDRAPSLNLARARESVSNVRVEYEHGWLGDRSDRSA